MFLDFRQCGGPFVPRMTRASALEFPLEVPSAPHLECVAVPEAPQDLPGWFTEGRSKLVSVMSQFTATCNQSSDGWGFTKTIELGKY